MHQNGQFKPKHNKKILGNPDSSKALPISPNATMDQIVCIRHWHENFSANLKQFAEGARDEKSIRRAGSIIQTCTAIIEGRERAKV